MAADVQYFLPMEEEHYGSTKTVKAGQTHPRPVRNVLHCGDNFLWQWTPWWGTMSISCKFSLSRQ
ncbi:hypothetical protein NON20_05185 [Synechocystis sp. B12]|nr:hypothetical protein NON20_05185 [Synechocystis sp. B12]